MVGDIEELEEMDATELHVRRLNPKGVLTPQRSGNFIFPIADGTVKSFERTASEIIHLVNSGSSRTRRRTRNSSSQMNYIFQHHFKTTQRRVMKKLKNDFWTTTGEFTYRHHPEPRVKLYVPKEETFPIPMKYIDVTRTAARQQGVCEKIKLIRHSVEFSNEIKGSLWRFYTRRISEAIL